MPGILYALLLSVGVQGWNNERPSWTPDGEIVFSSTREGNSDLFIMKADGSGQRNLTNSESDEHFPAVSPDGRAIAFVKPVDGNYDIYVLDRSDGTTRRVTNHESLDDWPAWYDGGSRIVFDSDRRIVFSSERQDGRQIYAYEPGNEIQLTNNERTNAHPAISPGGRMVVYNSGTDFWQLYLVPISGGEEHQLTSGEYDDRWAAWSPDGSSIAFESNRDGNWEIYVLDLDTKTHHRLSNGAIGRP